MKLNISLEAITRGGSGFPLPKQLKTFPTPIEIFNVNESKTSSQIDRKTNTLSILYDKILPKLII